MANFALAAAGGIACLAVGIILRYKRRRLNLPPSPPSLPVIGNLLDLPPNGIPEYLHWLHHKERYGPISSLRVLGKTLVILHDRHAAHQLLELQSLKSSARPKLEFASNMCDYGNLLPFQQYNSSYRQRRRLIHQLLGTKASVTKFDSSQEREAKRILFRALYQANTVIESLQSDVAATILKVTYGYTTEFKVTDPLVTLVNILVSNISRAAVPATWLVDFMPWIKHLPEWFPGTKFQKIARQYKETNHLAVDIPYQFAKKQTSQRGSSSSSLSYVSGLLQNTKEESVMDQSLDADIKWTAAVMYDAGAHTTVAAIKSFIAAMAEFPEVQRKAQREIESVVGTDRLPMLSDRASLPYVDALAQEVHRWYTVLPLGFPHVSTSDMVYDGYDIPKGAVIIVNVWWVLHNPDTYAEPERFDPERFLEPRNEPLPTAAFGFGRRICPGRFFSDSTLFLISAQLLAAFDIARAVDAQGREIKIELRSSVGAVPNLSDFPCRITPRSSKSADLVKDWTKDLHQMTGDSAKLDQQRVTEVLDIAKLS